MHGILTETPRCGRSHFQHPLTKRSSHFHDNQTHEENGVFARVEIASVNKKAFEEPRKKNLQGITGDRTEGNIYALYDILSTLIRIHSLNIFNH